MIHIFHRWFRPDGLESLAVIAGEKPATQYAPKLYQRGWLIPQKCSKCGKTRIVTAKHYDWRKWEEIESWFPKGFKP
jgi:hypothetical protein